MYKRQLLHHAVPGLLKEGTVPHVIVLIVIHIGPLAVLLLRCTDQLAVVIILEIPLRSDDLEVVDTVLCMFIDVLIPMRELIVMPVLMLPVVLVIPGIGV